MCEQRPKLLKAIDRSKRPQIQVSDTKRWISPLKETMHNLTRAFGEALFACDEPPQMVFLMRMVVKQQGEELVNQDVFSPRNDSHLSK